MSTETDARRQDRRDMIHDAALKVDQPATAREICEALPPDSGISAASLTGYLWRMRRIETTGLPEGQMIPRRWQVAK